MGKVAALCVALVLAGAAPARATDVKLLMRISVENLPSHFQAKTVKLFAERVALSCGKTLRVEYYEGAKLFRDVDVIAALGRGDVEMAVPGIWQFDKAVPDVAATMLPSVYGQTIRQARSLADGSLGSALNARIETATRSKVLGGWLDLGHAHLFGLGRPAVSIGAFKSKRIRVAGGRANEERIRALGAFPVSIPSPDLDAYLERRLVDGLLTTYETVDSAGMDARGVASVYEDGEYYPFYVPIVSASFWERLPPSTRARIARIWEELLPPAREESERAQAAAKARLVERGLRVHRPSQAELESTRRALLLAEEDMARRLGISEEILSLLQAAFAGELR